MGKRIFSSTLLLVIAAAAVRLFEAAGCIGLIVIAGMLTHFEFYKLLQKIGQAPQIKGGLICGFLLMLAAGLQGRRVQWWPTQVELLFLVITAVVLRALLSHSLDSARESIVSTIAGIIYVPFMCSFPIGLSGAMAASGMRPTAYIFTLFWMIFVIKCCDVGGMLCGWCCGKHKLALNFSPQKTVEGFAGGVLLSIFTGAGLVLLYGEMLPPRFGLAKATALSALLAVLSLIGDLTESAIKRLANEKDSGNVLPGIGGIFDLTDSLLFALPLGVIFIEHFSL
ncbi:MAG: phosphatidate cytidylyltransferase [Puniceicoccales bacterium]|jgi:phosphatidate cytidylyltransferase|nr:phosphatidate cytidylyltransferase [Puniceicoccales bacterium]